MNNNDTNRSIYQSKRGIIFRWITLFPFSVLFYVIIHTLTYYILLSSTIFVPMSESRYQMVKFLDLAIIAPLLASILTIFFVFNFSPNKKRLFVNIVTVLFVAILSIPLIIAFCIIFFSLESNTINKVEATSWCSIVTSIIGFIIGNYLTKE